MNKVLTVIAIIILVIFLCTNKEHYGRHHRHHHHRHHHKKFHFHKVHLAPKKVIHRIARKAKHLETSVVHEIPPGVRNMLEHPSVSPIVQIIRHEYSQIKHDVDYDLHKLNNVFNNLEEQVINNICNDFHKLENFSKKVGKSIENTADHVGNVLDKVAHKMDNDALTVLQSFLDPCYWLLNFACPVMTDTIEASLEAALSEETIEEEAEFDAIMLTIKQAVKKESNSVAKKMVGSMVSALITPIVYPMILIVLDSITKDSDFTNELDRELSNIITGTITGLILGGNIEDSIQAALRKQIESDSENIEKQSTGADAMSDTIEDSFEGLSFTVFIMRFTNGFLCSGELYDYPINEIIPGFVPYVYIDANKLGLNCSPSEGFENFGTDVKTSYPKGRYDELKKKYSFLDPEYNSRLVRVTDGTCKSNGYREINSTTECQVAGEHLTGRRNNDQEMQDNSYGYVGQRHVPEGCSISGSKQKLFPDGQQTCSDHNPCICVKKYQVLSSGQCKDKGLQSITSKIHCDEANIQLGLNGYQNDMDPKSGFNLSNVDKKSRPPGCAIHSSQYPSGDKKAVFFQNGESECGDENFNCICGDSRDGYEVIDTGTCEDKGLETVTDKSQCDHVINQLRFDGYQDDMPSGGFDGQGRPNGCAIQIDRYLHGKNSSFGGRQAAFFKEGTEKCGNNNFACICKPPSENVIISKGKSCEDSGYKSIYSTQHCRNSIKQLGFAGFKDEQPEKSRTETGIKFSSITNKGNDKPSGCSVDMNDKQGSYTTSKEGDCGVNNNDCICDSVEYDTVNVPNLNLPDVDGLEKVSNPTNIVKRTRQFGTILGSTCADSNMETADEDQCKKAAKQLNKTYGGVDHNQNNTDQPAGCGWDRKKDEVRYFDNGLKASIEVNGICALKNRYNNFVKSSGKCEDYGLYTVTEKDKCDAKLLEIGLLGYKDGMPENGYIGNGPDRPKGCTVDPGDSHDAAFFGNSIGECGVNDFDCICSSEKPVIKGSNFLIYHNSENNKHTYLKDDLTTTNDKNLSGIYQLVKTGNKTLIQNLKTKKYLRLFGVIRNEADKTQIDVSEMQNIQNKTEVNDDMKLFTYSIQEESSYQFWFAKVTSRTIEQEPFDNLDSYIVKGLDNNRKYSSLKIEKC